MLTLFHTDGCHLCEQAWALVEQAGLAGRSRRCDILDDADWLEAYRVRIPVVRDEAGRDRMKILSEKTGVFRCRTTFNCTDACPRGIEVTKAIQEVKRAILFDRF